MGDSIDSLSIVPIPTAFVDGSIKVVTGDTVKYIDRDITLNIALVEMNCWFEILDEGVDGFE